MNRAPTFAVPWKDTLLTAEGFTKAGIAHKPLADDAAMPGLVSVVHAQTDLAFDIIPFGNKRH